ncbi:MAG: carboxypeptidase-like regulatory domain-containing protein [Chloroflexota bacterium]
MTRRPVRPLEDAGADVIVRFGPTSLPDPKSLTAAAVHPSFREATPDALHAVLAQLPDDMMLVEVDVATYDRLIAGLRARPEAADLESEALDAADDLAEAMPLAQSPAGSSRLLRAALTVLAVTLVLWLGFGRFARPAEDPVPAAPPLGGAGAGQQPAGAGGLGGRVTRSDTNGSIGGATVVASGPSGPIATITDAQGRWRFAALRGGTYVVMSTAPRFVAKQVQVDVPDGRAIENVNLSLDPESP